MELKHFSHDHGLVFHQVPHGSQIHCSGCKSPGSGNVYACWQCSYFLHEKCFGAARSFKHPSHPLHPLTLVPFPTYPSASFFCNTCNIAGDGFSYSCSQCEFDIHLHCALNNPNPNPNPHLSHSQPLNPIYPPIQTPYNNPSHNPTNPNHHLQTYPPIQPPHNYPPHNPTIPNDHLQTYPPIQTVPYNNNPPHNPTNPNDHLQTYPPTFPNSPHPNQHNPPPPATTTTPPPPTYSTVVNATTVNPPPPKASSIIKHFSHPHALKLMEMEKKNGKVCSACEIEISGPSYCCTESHCTFNLHKTCFDSAREIRHKSHLEHPLTLLTAPPYSEGFTCNACLKDGKAFAYTCATCSYDLHIDCVQWPDSVTRSDHKHTLTLYYSSPAAEQASTEVAFMCNVCKNPVHEMAWMYYCRDCDFGTHLECVTSAVKPESGSGSESAAKTEEELMREVELRFAVLQLLAQATKNI